MEGAAAAWTTAAASLWLASSHSLSTKTYLHMRHGFGMQKGGSLPQQFFERQRLNEGLRKQVRPSQELGVLRKAGMELEELSVFAVPKSPPPPPPSPGNDRVPIPVSTKRIVLLNKPMAVVRSSKWRWDALPASHLSLPLPNVARVRNGGVITRPGTLED